MRATSNAARGDAATFRKWEVIFARAQSKGKVVARVSTGNERWNLRAFRCRMLKTLVPLLGYAYLWLVEKTSRVIWKGRQIPQNMESRGKNFIYAFWHSRQLFFVRSHRRQPVAILVSSSKDGEYIARLLHLSGIKTVRGSSTRGGQTALKRLLAQARLGLHPGITPDGPRGPARKVKPGVLFLARKTGLAILPIANACRRKKVFGSWDKIHLPLPFNRIAIVHGSPIRILPGDSLEAKAFELERALDKITQEADRLVR